MRIAFEGAGEALVARSRGVFDTSRTVELRALPIEWASLRNPFHLLGRGYRVEPSLFLLDAGDALSTGGEKEYLKLKLKPTSFNNGCCFDYGNAEVSNTDTGAGHMEAVYCGDTTYWGSGAGSGPWLMADLENGLFSDNNPKQNTQDPSIGGRFCCFDYEHVEDWFDHSITALGQKRSIFVWKAMPSGKPPRRYNTLINGRPLSILKRRARVPWAHRDFEV